VEPLFKLHEELFNLASIVKGWDDEFAIPIHCGLFRASLFNNIRFNESLKAKEDWVMWVQLYLLHPKTVFIDETLAVYRFLPNSMSRNKLLMNTNLVLAYQLIYELIPDQYKTIIFKKATDTLGQLLKETEQQLSDTRQSQSYKLGNFFVRNLKKVKGSD
jgi:hypothetical protein